jgi:oligopeptide/dipeptide ABC transporter ATP-binding protein
VADFILDISDLEIGFPTEGGGFARVVRNLDLAVQRNKTLGLVGESGSGKSITALSVIRMVPPPGKIMEGHITFKGKDLLAVSKSEVEGIRGSEISMIFQDPLTSLNPAFTVEQQLTDVIITHQQLNRKAARLEAIDILYRVGIPSPSRVVKSYPHQLSGGMRQRVLIGMAVSCRPDVLIADEPTTALDVTVQAQVILLLEKLREELGLTILFIAHNLDLVGEICDKVAVIYNGHIVEEAAVEDLFRSPLHPYTRALMRCIPKLRSSSKALEAIKGAPPAFGSETSGCSFEPRCPIAVEKCRVEAPKKIEIGDHWVACWAIDKAG